MKRRSEIFGGLRVPAPPAGLEQTTLEAAQREMEHAPVASAGRSPARLTRLTYRWAGAVAVLLVAHLFGESGEHRVLVREVLVERGHIHPGALGDHIGRHGVKANFVEQVGRGIHDAIDGLLCASRGRAAAGFERVGL